MKSFTDIEQSKKLADILPLESADMYWELDKNCSIEAYNLVPLIRYNTKERKELFEKDKELIPCWSLAALLSVLPLGIYDEFDGNDYELEIDMSDKMPRYIRLGDIYHSQFPYDFEKDALLDNIVESIIWLNDNNYFEL